MIVSKADSFELARLPRVKVSFDPIPVRRSTLEVLLRVITALVEDADALPAASVAFAVRVTDPEVPSFVWLALVKV